MDGQWMSKFEQEMHVALQERARLDERLARLHEEFQAQKANQLEDSRTACRGNDTRRLPEQDRSYAHEEEEEGDRGASEACFGPEIEISQCYNEAYFLVSDLEKTVQELQKELSEKDNDIELLKTTVSTLQGDLRHVQIQCEGRTAKAEKSIAALELTSAFPLRASERRVPTRSRSFATTAGGAGSARGSCGQQPRRPKLVALSPVEEAESSGTPPF